MKRCLIIVALAVGSAANLTAQQTTAKPAPAAAATPGSKVVATVNGENITAAELDRLWTRMGAKMRAQYEKAGNGKVRFLENYIGKRLLLQLASQSDFEKSPAVQAELEAAKEAALFDLYVRDVVATQIVTEAAVRKYYDEHQADFAHPEQVKARMIFIGKDIHSVEEARTLIGNLMKEMYGTRVASANNANAIIQAFSAAAKRSSEHPSAASGGDLGWLKRSDLDPKLAQPIFAMTPGAISGILENDAGMHLILVEDHLQASTEPYESARPAIREYLFSANAQKVVEAVNRATNELRSSSKVTLYPDNVE